MNIAAVIFLGVKLSTVKPLSHIIECGNQHAASYGRLFQHHVQPTCFSLYLYFLAICYEDHKLFFSPMWSLTSAPGGPALESQNKTQFCINYIFSWVNITGAAADKRSVLVKKVHGLFEMHLLW